jgi:hypothetical protein
MYGLVEREGVKRERQGLGRLWTGYGATKDLLVVPKKLERERRERDRIHWHTWGYEEVG